MKNHKQAKIREEIKKKHFRVSVFGSGRVKKGSKEYNLAYTLGRMLGERGIDIVTGGGSGSMEAASRGHRYGKKKAKKKADTIGLTIKLPMEQSANKAVDVERQFAHFSKRLDNFMLLSNAVIILPGGVGTMLELFYTWQLVQVKQICNIPIILLDGMWPDLIKWLEKWPLKRKFFSKHDINQIFLAEGYNEAIKMVEKANEEYKKGNKNFCLNYKKYKLY